MDWYRIIEEYFEAHIDESVSSIYTIPQKTQDKEMKCKNLAHTFKNWIIV